MCGENGLVGMFGVFGLVGAMKGTGLLECWPGPVE